MTDPDDYEPPTVVPESDDYEPPTVVPESEVDTRIGGLPPPDGATWLAGDAVGRYVLREELGRGGMGQVFRAFDPDLGRDVALKLIRAEYGQEQAVVGRFLREAHLTARLQHPGIVPVYELGRSVHGSIYYSMRLVRGHTLREVVERLALEDPESWSSFRVLQAVVQVCRAVAYAHQHGVLHRDLKPSNVMIGDYGEVYVLDWGLAKSLEAAEPPLPVVQRLDDEEGTQVGTVLGTPAFMAPEQGLGETLGFPADVYSLGGILYFVLTGKAPRQGSSSEVLRSVVKGSAPQRPGELRADVPPALERLALHALEGEPAKRLQSARALAEGVLAFLEGRAVPGEGADAEFLRGYSAGDYRRPSVAVDVALTRPGEGGDEVWLQQRSSPPCEGLWAFPGSFVRLEESLEQAAQRVLDSEVGVSDPVEFNRLGVFDAPNRDPRTRVISVALRAKLPTSASGADPAGGAWFKLAEVVGPLAFDHDTILAKIRGE